MQEENVKKILQVDSIRRAIIPPCTALQGQEGCCPLSPHVLASLATATKLAHSVKIRHREKHLIL